MILNGLPSLDPASVKFDHSFVFDAHNYSRKQLITRWRGTVVERTHLGYAVTGWQKSSNQFWRYRSWSVCCWMKPAGSAA